MTKQISHNITKIKSTVDNNKSILLTSYNLYDNVINVFLIVNKVIVTTGTPEDPVVSRRLPFPKLNPIPPLANPIHLPARYTIQNACSRSGLQTNNPYPTRPQICLL